jgi:predicted  nucleic acid-binding Zn-ribbon protein
MNDINTNEELRVSNQEDSEDNTEQGSKVIEYFTEEIKSIKIDLKETLNILYNLKLIDKELAEIEEEKGDLPAKISELLEEIDDIKNEKLEGENELISLSEEEIRLTEENKSSEAKIYKYEEEKYNVKNNKEYDRITQTIDSLYEVVQNNEERLKEIISIKDEIKSKSEEMESSLTDLNNELEENKALLSELNKEHEVEELEFNSKRSKLLVRLNDDIKFQYEKINGTYKGEAVAVVRKGNCSGCYNSIPPQRELEIKSAEVIFQCQSCGRILVDESQI